MSLFEYIKSHLSITDVINEYVQLKPVGNYFKGHCPFHYEKDASFTVSPDKQIFYCFGCQVSGDLISFVAKIENITQFEALQELIDHYQINVPEKIKKQITQDLNNSEQKHNYFNICKAMANWANYQLSINIKAKQYLTTRGFNENDISYFNIGYFPGGIHQINKLIKELAKQSILSKDLIEAGIIHQGQSVLYSPFEERILFPIKDQLGRYCGFGGRIFKPNDQRAKYYNSKENSYFFKSKLLFGLDLAKKDMQQQNFAFLVEGYTDCVAMIKYGYKNTVATLGTSCTQDHLNILARYIKILYVIYDGDNAGQQAILRLTQLCWDVNLELKIIKLPANHDPASFLKENGNLNNLITQSYNIFTFFIKTLGENFYKQTLAEKISISNKIIELISKIDNSIKQEILLQQASNTLQIPIETLKINIKCKNSQKNTNFTKKNTPKNEKKIPILEERIFFAIINSVENDKKLKIDKDLIPYFSKNIRLLLKKFKDIYESQNSTQNIFEKLIDSLDESQKKWVLSSSVKYNQDVSQDLFDQLIVHFCKKNWRNIVQDLKNKLREAEKENDTKKQKELFNLFSKFKQNIKNRGLI
ncbi:DNA primase [Candidatus Dependentiae bacterium]|nr:DNA primase [Candidatus Dependentiae bacterium]